MCSNEEWPEENSRIKLNKLLRDSVFSKDFEQTCYYLNKGADAGLRVYIDAGNLLHHTKDPRIAAELLRRGARVDARNRFRLTPLFIAVKDGNYKLAKVLLKNGADVRCFDKRHRDISLNIAVMAGNYKLVKLLLEYGSPVNDQTNFNSNTPLHLAVSSEHFCDKIFNLLLGKGADAKGLNKSKESPLHLALQNNHCTLYAIKKLISLGACVNAVDIEGICPLQYALNEDNYEAVKLLLKHGAVVDINTLNDYITSGDAESKIVKCLLKHGCKLGQCYANVLTKEGLSPLMLALYSLSHIDIYIFKHLLHYNGDPLLTLTEQRGSYTMFEKTLYNTEQSAICSELMNEGQLRETFRKRKSPCVQVMKWVIKYSATKSEDNICIMQSKLRDKNDYFYDFLKECLVELSLFNKEFGVPLNDLMKPESIKNILPNHVVDKIIQMLPTDSFPIYKEVMADILKRSDLVNSIKYKVLCVNTDDGKKYSLNWTVTCHLVKYLRSQDLVNLFVAFYCVS